MRWRRNPAGCLLLAWVVLAAGTLSPLSGDVAGQDSGEVNLAGIVIDYGDGRETYAIVPFAEDSLSGMDLVERSGLAIVTIEFGGLGNAVCTIEETGCDLSACRARLCQTGDPDSPFWRYAQSTPDGDWRAAPLGPSSTTVEDGDVDGWFWTGRAPDRESETLQTIAERLDVDLDALRVGTSESLTPSLITTGGAGNEQAGPTRWQYLGGGLILAVVVAIGALAVIRSRRMAGR